MAGQFFFVISGPQGVRGDLVLLGGDHLDLLVFSEVKTRTRRDYGRPMGAVNAEKRALITLGAT